LCGGLPSFSAMVNSSHLSALAAATWIASTAANGTDLASIKAASPKPHWLHAIRSPLEESLQQVQLGLGLVESWPEAAIRA